MDARDHSRAHAGADTRAAGTGQAEGAEAALVPQANDTGAEDALRRTRLANERTYLAWWRTGLTTIAVSLAAGKLGPELSNGAVWPFQVIGIAFGAVGVSMIAYAYVRQKRVDEALERGEYAPFNRAVGLSFSVLGMLLGAGTIIVILAQPSS